MDLNYKNALKFYSKNEKIYLKKTYNLPVKAAL